MKRRKSKRISLVLALILAIGMMPAAVFGADGEIDEVSFSFTEPEAGDSIENFINSCDTVVPESVHYSVQSIESINEIDAMGTEQGDDLTSGTFEDKKAYSISFIIKADEGYVFTSDYEDGWFDNAEINGGWPHEGWILDNTTLTLSVRFAIGLTKVEKVILTFPEPNEGKTPGTIGNGIITSVPDGSLSGSFECVWFENDENTFSTIASEEDFENKRMSENDTFQAGKYYGAARVNVSTEIAEGYWIDWYTLELDNGTTLDHDYLSVYFGPLGEESEETEVECVWMIFPEPVVGKTPAEIGSGSVYGEPEGSIVEAEFDMVWFECEDDTFSFVTEETLETAAMSDSDVFKAGYYYAAWPCNGILMKASEGYHRADDVRIDVATGEWSNNTLLWSQFGPLQATVETPEFDPADGMVFSDKIDVTISCPTEGASIYYTMDGSTPTAESTLTTGAAITLNETTTLKAIAILDGYNDSEIAEATYTLRASGGNRPPRDPDPVDPEPAPADKPSEPAPEKSTFVDVDQEDYFYDAVEWAVENKITSGVSADKFGPDQDCTRAQVVTFLWLASGSPNADPESVFDDVDANAYYEKAVAWAVEQGVTAGTAEGEFSPETTVTRAQFITMLWAAKGKPEADGSAPFGDVAADAYYAKAVAWAYANGITAGKSADLFAPDDPCTRGQIVTFLHGAFGE